MIGLVAWASVCTVLALSFQRRPGLILGIILVLRVAIPSAGGWVLIGNWSGSGALHPATLLLFIWMPFFLVSRLSEVRAEVRRWKGIYLGLGAFVAFSLVVLVSLRGITSLLGFSNSVLAGIVFFFAIRVAAMADRDVLGRLARTLIFSMAGCAAVAVVQWAIGANLPWSLLIQFPAATRALGTFDSPLDMGLAIAITIPLLRSMRRAVFKYGLMLLLLIAVIVSESRVPALLAVIACVYVLLSGLKSIRATVSAVVVLTGAALLFSALPIAAGLTDRFVGDDGNSSSARAVANRYIVEHLQSVLFVGRGWGSSYDLKGEILRTSLENGYAILAFDIGGLIVLLLLLVQLRMTFLRRGLPGSWMSAAFVVAGGFIYSGIATMSAISLVMWSVLAFSMARIPVKADVDDPAKSVQDPPAAAAPPHAAIAAFEPFPRYRAQARRH